jgi:hypothetical protein
LGFGDFSDIETAVTVIFFVYVVDFENGREFLKMQSIELNLFKRIVLFIVTIWYTDLKIARISICIWQEV